MAEEKPQVQMDEKPQVPPPAAPSTAAPEAPAPAASTGTNTTADVPAASAKRPADEPSGEEGPAAKRVHREADAVKPEIDEEAATNTEGKRDAGRKRGPNFRAQSDKQRRKGQERGRPGRTSWFDKKKKKDPLTEEEAIASGATSASEKKEGDEEGEGSGRLPKKRAAIMLGYCGTGYSGMQIQTHGSQTIEGDFFAALAKAGAISEENAKDHKKVDLQRAARTDAGVHAAGNCISLKMILNPPVPPEFSDLTEYVNSFLPDQIRMWGFVRTMKSFQARTACDSRVYEYLLPTYCLLPPATDDPFAKTLDETSPGWRDVVKVPAEFVNAAPPVPISETGEIDPRARGEFERRRNWRCDTDTFNRFRDIVATYKGTHNFHNYTVGKPFKDNSVKRFMISLIVREPKVYGDIEWISVQIHGQSFMLHQIRKMISLAMLACRTGTPASLLNETFGPKRIHIPKAPPLGLLLQEPVFKTYNHRARTLPNTDNEKRSYVDFTPFREKMDAFKVSWIYERLREEELKNNVFHKWIRQIDCTSSKDFSFLNTAGTIPDEALVTLTSKKYFEEQPKKKRRDDRGEEAGAAEEAEAPDAEAGEEPSGGNGYESEDEEIDMAALRRGEFEG